MGSQQKPILEIAKFGFADNVRADRNRLPGMCRAIVNTAPNLSGSGERIRRGYTAYTAVTAPTGTQILQVAPVQSPSQQDVHIWFSTNGVYQSPYWINSSPYSNGNTNVKVSEVFGTTGTPFDPTNGDVSFPVDHKTMVIANLATTGNAVAMGFTTTIVNTTGYFNNFCVYNVTKNNYAFCKSYTQSGGTGTFIFVETLVVDANKLNWATGDTFVFTRNFHNNLTFAATYNTDLANAPIVNSDKSVIRFSGGQSSAAGNVGIISQYINRTFWPQDSTNTFTFTGTYVSERRLKPVDVRITDIDATIGTMIAPSAGFTALPDNSTYWLAIAPIYDYYQIGELQRYETVNTHYSNASNTNRNYIASGASFVLRTGASIIAATLNKRITGFAFYVAQDIGDTRTTGRQSQYFYVSQTSLVNANKIGAALVGQWALTYNSTIGYFAVTIGIGGAEWAARGNDYTTDAGIVEVPSDTMYAYSDELVLGSRRFLTNVYVTSEGIPNRDNLWTNPIGANADINAGIVAIDMFSNEDGFYRLRAEPTVGTKINGMRITGLEDVLVLKDRGALHGRLIVDSDGIPDFIWSVLSHDIGCSTLRGHTFSDDAWIYFAGYDDIYRYRNGGLERLIENVENQNDWLYTYQVLLAKTYKESVCCFYLPEREVFFDIGQVASPTGAQMAAYPDYGWRQVALKETTITRPYPTAGTFIRWTTRLQNGTVLVVDTSGNVYQWSNPTTGAFYSTDNGTAIYPYIDTGSFIPSGDEGMDTVLNYWALSRTFDQNTVGQLDIDLYKDGSIVRSYTSQDKTSIFLPINNVVSDARQGNWWRLVLNSNTSTPEHLNAGTILTLNKIFLYGEFRKRSKRASEHSAGTTIVPLGGCVSNQVGGFQEVTLNRAPQTFTWDVPFTKTYTSATEGAGTPSYVIKAGQSPYVVGSDKSQVPLVTVSAQTLTTFTAYASEDNVRFHFEATE